MSVTHFTTWDPLELPPAPVHRFTVDEYHRLIETGLLTERHRVELLEGWLVTKMTRKPPHDVALELARRAIERLLAGAWHTRDQKAITTSDSEPEPDLAVVAGDVRDYLARHPGPADIGLIIEVADTSLAEDRLLKARIFARAGLPSYWIINLPDSVVEVFSEPTGPTENPSYRQCQTYRAGNSVAVILAGRALGQIAVTDLLP